MKRHVLCLLLCMVLLAGCATDRGRTQAEGTGVGAGAGAAAGALLGALLGGEKGAAIGAGAGALVGSGAGYLVGTHVANKKAQYAKTEDYLDAVIASARQVNDQTRQYNASLRSQVERLDRETVALVKQYNQKTIRKAGLQKEEQTLAAKIAETQGHLQKVQNELKIQRQVLAQEQGQSPERLEKLQVQVTELERNKAELEQHINRLASIKTRVAV